MLTCQYTTLNIVKAGEKFTNGMSIRQLITRRKSFTVQSRIFKSGCLSSVKYKQSAIKGDFCAKSISSC